MTEEEGGNNKKKGKDGSPNDPPNDPHREVVLDNAPAAPNPAINPSARDRARTAEKVFNECAQIDKWIGAKQKMVDVIGAPSTDAVPAKFQNGYIQLMKAEMDLKKAALEHVNGLANDLMAAVDKDSVEELQKKIDALNRRWHSLESGLDEKAQRIEKTAKLGDEFRMIYEELKNELGELESNVEKASAMSPNDIGDQLATLDSLKSRFGGVGKALEKLKDILNATEDLEVDATNRAEIQEQLESTQKKADELERKIESVKEAALNAQNEGVELENTFDALLSVVNSAENELKQTAPIAAYLTKLLDELKRAEDVYKKLVESEGDVSLLKAKVADKLKKKPDAELKKKLEAFDSKWQKVVSDARDRKDLVTKATSLLPSAPAVPAAPVPAHMPAALTDASQLQFLQACSDALFNVLNTVQSKTGQQETVNKSNIKTES